VGCTDTTGDYGCYGGTGLGLLPQPDPGCPTGGDETPPPAPAPAPAFSLQETFACTGSYYGQYALDVTYQLMENGSPVTSLSGLGVNYISEKLTNQAPTTTLLESITTGAGSPLIPGEWCSTPASCPIAADASNGLNPNGTFTDILSWNGSLTQSFYLNGASLLSVGFSFLGNGFVGPNPSYTALKNVYNSRGKNITVANGLLNSKNVAKCNQ
jgi:hypothetical protein